MSVVAIAQQESATSLDPGTERTNAVSSLALPFGNNATPTSEPSTQLSVWKDRLEDILSSENDEIEKGPQLLELFPSLTQDSQVESAEYLSNLLPDQQFPALADYLTSAATSSPVRDVVMAGLLSRPDTLRLPYLLEIARDDQNPEAAEAKGLLQAMLDEDFADDWTRWQAEVNRWLKDYSD
jgi:hypothetical protein